MDVAGGGVDVGVAQQRLHHRQVDPGLGQGGAERVPQRVRMPGRRPRSARGGSGRPCAARPRSTAAPGSGPWPPGTAGRWPIRGARPADRPGSPRRRRHRAGPGVPCSPLPMHPQPAAADVDIGDVQAQHLGRAQPAVQHQPGDRPVPPGAEAGQQLGRLRLGQRRRQPARLAQPQRGAVLRPADRCAPASRCARPSVRQRASRPFGHRVRRTSGPASRRT